MGRKFDVAKCIDCGTRRKVEHREWIRAARPRCYACGGPVEVSNQAAGEHIESEHTARVLSRREIDKGHIVQ